MLITKKNSIDKIAFNLEVNLPPTYPLRNVRDVLYICKLSVVFFHEYWAYKKHRIRAR